jgi:hypothetical protein
MHTVVRQGFPHLRAIQLARYGTFTLQWLSDKHCAAIFDAIESRAMSDPERFSVPFVIEEILDRLLPEVALHVPDHILAIWFPPGPADGVMP